MTGGRDGFASSLPSLIRTLRSPNHGPRIGYEAPDSVVLHYTGMVDGAAALARLCDPASQVSCHYVVDENGSLLQLVDEDRRAWCCGRSSWQGVTDMNSASISIEIVNGGHDFGLPPFPAAQVAAVSLLCCDIMHRHGIPSARVLAHSDIAPGRKRDPGERFPWSKLAEAGVGLWPPDVDDWVPLPLLSLGTHGPAVSQLQATLAGVGYGIGVDGVFGPETQAVIEAFQRRYRPERIDGVADDLTRMRLHALTRR